MDNDKQSGAEPSPESDYPDPEGRGLNGIPYFKANHVTLECHTEGCEFAGRFFTTSIAGLNEQWVQLPNLVCRGCGAEPYINSWA